VAGTTTLTLPAATDTLVGKATTDTLTNKTLTGAAMNGTLGATTPSTVAATSISASTTLGVTGVSTLTGGAVIEGLTVGRGGAGGAANTAYGASAIPIAPDSGVVAIGSNAGKLFNTASDTGQSTFVGYFAGAQVSTGTDSTFVGGSAGTSTTTGAKNTAVGSQALQLNTTASNNTAVGYQAGYNITTGANNACFGYIAGTDTVRNITTNSNEIVMGNNSHTAAYIKIAWTVTSDSRDKTSFAPVPHGLAFVNSLTPTAYQFRVSREDETATGPVRYGFKAQDILAIEGDSPVIIDNSDSENLKYNQDSMIAILVNAIKELNAKVQSLEAQIKGA
jgi:hypothetical protein